MNMTTVDLTQGEALAVAPWQGSTPVAGDFGPASLAVAPPADARFAHLGWPKVTRTPKGTLVAAYMAARFHGSHGEGCPAVSLSYDHGASFSPPRVLQRFDAGAEYDHAGNVAMGIAGDGAVVLLAMAFRGEEAHTILGWRSEDDGRTWHATDVSALAGGHTGSVYGHVFPVPTNEGQKLGVVGHYRVGGTGPARGLWISYSADDGRTWGTPQTITTEQLVEPCALHAGGRLVGLFREQIKERSWRWRQGISENGRDWSLSDSALAGEHDRMVLPSPFIVEDPDEPGQLYALQAERVFEGGRAGAIYLWRAQASRLDWNRGPCLARFAHAPGDLNTDFGYPWMAPSGDGRKWCAVFYFGQVKGPNAIWSLTFDPRAHG